MKQLIVLAALATSTLLANAQFGTAPDFNVTDIDGNQHQLYADILNQGLIAVVDVLQHGAVLAGTCTVLMPFSIFMKPMVLMAPTNCVSFSMKPMAAQPWLICWGTRGALEATGLRG